MLWTDPYDEIALRVLVGRASGRCEGRVPTTSSATAWRRLGQVRARWTTGKPMLSGELQGSLSSTTRNAMLSERSTSATTTRRSSWICSRVNSRSWAHPLGQSTRFARRSESLPRTRRTTGLPIGLESSGPLGSVYLLSADSVHALGRIGLVRYTDDSWLFLRSTTEWDSARDEYVALLKDLGLQLNHDKSDVHDKVWDDPEEVIRHGGIAYATDGGSKKMSADEANEMLGDAVRSKDWKAIRFCLTTLKRSTDAWWVESPACTPRRVRHDRRKRGRLHDGPRGATRWRGGRSTRTGSSTWRRVTAIRATLFGQLHACRVLAALQTTKMSAGSSWSSRSHPCEQQAKIPLQTWATTAWASSAFWNPSRAIDGVIDKGSLSIRRAFVLELCQPHPQQVEREACAQPHEEGAGPRAHGLVRAGPRSANQLPHGCPGIRPREGAVS